MIECKTQSIIVNMRIYIYKLPKYTSNKRI